MGIETDNASLRAEWRSRVEVRGGWRKSQSHAGGLFDVDQNGEAGGFFVELGELPGRRAYLKPLKKHGWQRAAREKIAADLATDIGVDVPPVLLAINENSTAERHVSVSLVMYPQQFSWGQLQHHMEAASPPFSHVSARLPESAARALAFDTWIAQTDHEKPSNIVYGYEGAKYGAGKFLFLDFAFSMGISDNWSTTAGVCTEARLPEYLRAHVHRPTLASTIEAIEGVTEATLRDVVDRIPWQWMPDEKKQAILTGLLARRTMVRPALSHYLKESP